MEAWRVQTEASLEPYHDLPTRQQDQHLYRFYPQSRHERSAPASAHTAPSKTTLKAIQLSSSRSATRETCSSPPLLASQAKKLDIFQNSLTCRLHKSSLPMANQANLRRAESTPAHAVSSPIREASSWQRSAASDDQVSRLDTMEYAWRSRDPSLTRQLDWPQTVENCL